MPLRVLARRLRIVAGVLLALALLVLLACLFAMTWRPSPRAFPVQGVDVHEGHGAIDWYALGRGSTGFAYTRATIGADARDTRFAENWRGIYAAGLPRGAIHVFSMCRLAIDQARNFVTTVPRSEGLLSPAVELDFQPDCSARPDRDVLLRDLAEFILAIEAHLGQDAILKVTRRYEARYRVSAAIMRPLWSVGAFAPPQYLARPWRLWQSSRFRRVEGVDKPINWNVRAP